MCNLTYSFLVTVTSNIRSSYECRVSCNGATRPTRKRKRKTPSNAGLAKTEILIHTIALSLVSLYRLFYRQIISSIPVYCLPPPPVTNQLPIRSGLKTLGRPPLVEGLAVGRWGVVALLSEDRWDAFEDAP